MMKNIIKKIAPGFILNWYHFCLSFFGALIFGFPSCKLKVIAVTGTKGKTTTVELIKRIFEEAGRKTGSISSIRLTVGEKERENKFKMTMPGRFVIQKFLRQAVKAGCQYFVFEATSEGIFQHRHRFIKYDAAVFTNLSPEHIERHGSFEKYREAKGKLFKSCQKTHILNLDDENAEYFLRFPAEEKWGYGINEKFKMKNGKLQLKIKNLIEAESARAENDAIYFSISNSQFIIPLTGEFNVYNALSAIAVAQSQGISLGVCQKALGKINLIPGRMEVVIKEPFEVIVDYAHTAQSLEQVYKTLRNSKFQILPTRKSGSRQAVGTNSKQIQNSNVQNSKLICVLGSCGGGRDRWKRPEMGKIAAEYCDETILTNEDPYDENSLSILEDIEKGVLSYRLQVTSYKKILDRREAIKKALGLAKPGDTVVITGKGSECWMCVEKGKKIPWSDKQIVLEEYQKLRQRR